MPRIPVNRAPVKRRYHNLKGSRKHMQFTIAPSNETNTILFCVTEQARNVLVSSQMQNRKTKFNRKIYSM